MRNLTQEQKEQFSKILEEVGKALDITEEQYNAAVTSYRFVAEWLSASDSLLSPYHPEILPQGSFLLGTMIKPIHEDDELDVDLVCRLEGKRYEWTQYNLKQIVGDRLKAHGTLKRLLRSPDGRRCWTLDYADTAKFHMDVLPSIVSRGYKIILERALSANYTNDAESLAIRITDKESQNYLTAFDPSYWLKSNPFGYALWFEERAKLALSNIRMMSEAIQPVPKYQKEKLPLQRIIQILKRHRDMMFDGDCDKPISIILTTLAARAYNKETNIIEGLLNVVDQLSTFIEERFSYEHGRVIKWISNPVNALENFADKWPENPKKERNFYNWLSQIKVDLNNALNQKGLHNIQEALQKPLGNKIVTTAFNNYGGSLLKLREQGQQHMATNTGMLGASGILLKNHNFHGTKE